MPYLKLSRADWVSTSIITPKWYGIERNTKPKPKRTYSAGLTRPYLSGQRRQPLRLTCRTTHPLGTYKRHRLNQLHPTMVYATYIAREETT